MKSREIAKRIVFGAGSVLLTASNALAAPGDGFADTVINGLDSSIRPYAQLTVPNIYSIFQLVIIGAIFGFSAWSAIEERRGHSQQASNSKNHAISVFWIGIGAYVLYNLFVWFSGKFGM